MLGHDTAMSERNKKELNCLYITKTLCSVIVILLHCPFPGLVGRFIVYFLRFPVPIFFMISGYFLKDDITAYEKRMFSTVKYIFTGEAICGLVQMLLKLYSGTFNFSNIISDIFEKNIIITILCGSVFNGTLWYLYALLWTYISFLLLKLIREKLLFNFSLRLEIIITFVLLMMEIPGRMLCQNISDINNWIWIFRSFLLQGIPFVMIGKIIRANEAKLLSFFTIPRCIMWGGSVFICIC